MSDPALTRTILLQIDRVLKTIQQRIIPIRSPNDFTETDAGLEKLDAICMQLIALGESVKNLDKATSGKILIRYPQVEWKKVMGMRDVISHHYFDMDAEIVFTVCREHVPEMSQIVEQMLSDIGSEATGRK